MKICETKLQLPESPFNEPVRKKDECVENLSLALVGPCFWLALLTFFVPCLTIWKCQGVQKIFAKSCVSTRKMMKHRFV